MYCFYSFFGINVNTGSVAGYGDSSSVTLNEEGLVADTKLIFKYLRGKAGNSPIFVWGHSLGTGYGLS